MIRIFGRRGAAVAGALALALATSGCDLLVGAVVDVFPGPPPDQVGLTGETVIIRRARQTPETGMHYFYVDRVRLLETDPHNINRVIEVRANELQARVDSLALKVGDRVVINTRYLADTEAGELSPYIPNWPFDRYGEYPVGLHALTAIERTGP